MRTAAAGAELATTRYFAILELERANVDQAGRKIYPTDPLFVVSNLMATLAKRQESLRDRMAKTFVAIGVFYSAKADVAEFLVRNWDAAPTMKERLTFADKATSEKYNKLAAAARAAETTMLDLERGNAKLIEDRKTLWNVKIGRPQ